MKKFTLLSLIFISIIFSSCTFTEDIYINDDGTGKFTMDMDGSSLMAMIPKDSGKVEKNIDSTFTFKELFELKSTEIPSFWPRPKRLGLGARIRGCNVADSAK